jgi:hypothetical protein
MTACDSERMAPGVLLAASCSEHLSAGGKHMGSWLCKMSNDTQLAAANAVPGIR